MFDLSASGPLPSQMFQQSAPLPLGFLESLFHDSRVPLAAAFGYVVISKALNPSHEAAARAKPSGKLMKTFCLVHNIALAVFSAVVFLSVTPAYISHLTGAASDGAEDSTFLKRYCDVNHSFWNRTLGYWTWLFYLSKYYELVDTAIIILKGKRASLLQTYHHFGVLLCMHLAYYAKTNAIVVMCIFNSFIHTLMYTRFAFVTVGIHPPGKQVLTQMQIGQFLIGMTWAASYLVLDTVFGYGSCLVNQQGRQAVWFNIAYLVPLTFLFFDFMWKTYGRRSRSTASTPSKAVKKTQ